MNTSLKDVLCFVLLSRCYLYLDKFDLLYCDKRFIHYRTGLLFIQPVDCQSTFCVAWRPSSTSVNFPSDSGTFLELPLTAHVVGRPSVNYCQLSVRPIDHLLTTITFLCPRETYCQFPSTFHSTGRPVKFRRHSMPPGDLL